jgi:hypothetical protein
MNESDKSADQLERTLDGWFNKKFGGIAVATQEFRMALWLIVPRA